MNSRFSDHIKSNVVGYVALFLALTVAPAWAGALAPNSVTSETIRDGQVKTPDLRAGAVTAGKLALDSVGTGNVIDGAIVQADVNSDQIQLRVSGTCSPGSAVRAIATNGTVSCETDDIGSGGPPSGPAGGDLTGTYPSPTIASDAVGSGEIANGSVGGVELATDSVFTSKILDGTIGATDIGTNAVTSPDILDATITGADISDGTVAAIDIATSGVGDDELKTLVPRFAESTIAGGANKLLTKACSAGEVVIAGGGGATDKNTVINFSGPTDTSTAGGPTTWGVRMQNNGFDTQSIKVTALCLG